MKSYADAKRKINSNINKVLFVFMMPSWEIKWWCISIKQTGFGARRTGGSKQQTKKRLRDCAEWQSCQSRWMKWFHHVWSQQQEKDDSKTIMSRIAQEIWSETKEAERVPFSYLVIIRLHSIYHLESSPPNSDFKLPTIPKLRYLWFLLHLQQCNKPTDWYRDGLLRVAINFTTVIPFQNISGLRLV